MANYVNFTKSTFDPFNSKVLNEGQFSWMTQDTDQQIGSERANMIDVWMYDNKGNSWYEKGYEGYGEFGGMDYYELLATMNGYSEEDLKKGQEMRGIGIDLAFNKLKTKDKGRKVLFPALVANGKYNWKRHDFTQEAESDPNQSWYQEPEYDDYEDDYYESEEITEAREWGTFGTPEAKTVIKDLDKALQKFTSALAKAHNDYMKAVTLYTDGPKSDVGNKSGFNDSEGRHAVHYYTMGAIQQALGMKGFGGSLDYKVDWMYESKDWTRLMEDLGLNEGRSINKISKDHAETVSAMASTVKEWKEAEGDRKAELLDKLRMLNKKKADLEKELDDAVAGKDKNIQLALDEAEELAYLEKDLIEIYESEGILNEYSTDNFNPIEIPKKEELNSTFFKKLMPRTSKTIKDATKRIESWAGGTMFTHVQYFEVRPNGNAEDRPTYRIHNEQHWLNDTQLGWAGRSGEKVNVTKISVYDISEGEGNEIFFGKAYVDTDVYLKEHRVVFEELKRRS